MTICIDLLAIARYNIRTVKTGVILTPREPPFIIGKDREWHSVLIISKLESSKCVEPFDVTSFDLNN